MMSAMVMSTMIIDYDDDDDDDDDFIDYVLSVVRTLRVGFGFHLLSCDC